MAVQAPLHLQATLGVHQRHAVDLPVATVAADTLVDMNAVVEIDEIRQFVSPLPLDGPAAAEAFADRFQHRRVRPDLRMAIHARLRRRDAGEAGRFHRRVAIAAVDTVAAHVPLVAERYRLLPVYSLPTYVARTLHLLGREEGQACRDYYHDDRNAGNCIKASMKDLGHRMARSSLADFR